MPTRKGHRISEIGSRIARARSRPSARRGVMYSSRMPGWSPLSASILAIGAITAAKVLPEPVGTWIRATGGPRDRPSSCAAEREAGSSPGVRTRNGSAAGSDQGSRRDSVRQLTLSIRFSAASSRSASRPVCHDASAGSAENEPPLRICGVWRDGCLQSRSRRRVHSSQTGQARNRCTVLRRIQRSSSRISASSRPE